MFSFLLFPFQKEVTFTPRLLLVDLKGSLGALAQYNDLYDDITIPEVTEDSVLWDTNSIEIEQTTKCEKNEFLNDIEQQEEEVDDETCEFNIIKKNVLAITKILEKRFHRLQPR